MLSDRELENLANKITRDAVDRNHPSIDAGYTYLGQMIAHDIVPVTTRHSGSITELSEYQVHPALNLDSIYGNDNLCEKHIGKDGKFMLSSLEDNETSDLLRYEDGRARIPESRNDQHTIVSQLHLFWQTLHNALIDGGFAADRSQARKYITLLFQLVAVEDFLRQVLNEKVFDHYFHKTPTYKLNFNLEANGIPEVFSKAAFRFGHTMVRSSYEAIGKGTSPINLSELFRPNKKLNDAYKVDWSGFFGWQNEHDVQNAMRFNPWIASDFAAVTGHQGEKINLALHNLEASRSLFGHQYVNDLLGSASGPEIARQFGLSALSSLGELAEVANVDLDIKKLPLWLYILLESMEQENRGLCLGVLGSLISAEVLRQAIDAAEHSIYDDRPYHIESVLHELGELGNILQKIMSADNERVSKDRPFSMRVIIEFLKTQNT